MGRGRGVTVPIVIDHVGVMSWSAARTAAHGATLPAPPLLVPLGGAGGGVLAQVVHARSDLPTNDTSAMDGWAVAGPAPWRIVGEVLAGCLPEPLATGTAVTIATGAMVPAGADGVLRREWAQRVDDQLLLGTAAPTELRQAQQVATRQDVRPAGQECRAGDVVLTPGARLGPVEIGLLAASGQDDVLVRRADADVLVLGDELLSSGPARDGRVRDALGPMLSQWLPTFGLTVRSQRRVADTAEDLLAEITSTKAHTVVTTGSTAQGPVDHLHRALRELGADLVVDGVAVRPGHPQLMALLPDGRPLVGLPGNPLAAVSAVQTILAPVAAALHGLPMPGLRPSVVTVDVPAGLDATRLLPLKDGAPVLFAGPSMLRGLAMADCLAVIPPGGVRAGGVVDTFPPIPER